MRAASKKAFQDALKRFVESLAKERGAPHAVRVNTPLFSSGLVRSIEVLDLIVLVEGLSGRTVPDRAITLQNLRSIQAITHAFWEEA